MNTFIREYRASKASAAEPNRTRPYIEFICFHCKKTVSMLKASYKEDKPCRECVKRLRGKDSFLRAAKGKFGDAFDLTLAEQEYFDYTTPVSITCNKHNYTYKIKPVHFVAASYDNQPHKGGCPKCAEEINKSKNRKSINHYLSILTNKFPEIEVISHGNAETSLETIQLNCKVHGKFEKTLAKIVNSDPSITNLCPTCSSERHAWRSRMAREDIPGFVYFVKFKDVNLYKCGVTYKTVNDRLKGHLENIDQLWLLKFDTLSDAYFFEYQFFREYKEYKCKYPDTSLGGYTEFFNSAIPKPSKRFIEEILCRKESNSGELPPQHSEDNPERSLKRGTCND